MNKFLRFSGTWEDKSSHLFVLDRETKKLFLIDAGAIASIVPPTNKIQNSTKRILYAANGSPIATYGGDLRGM